ncbi:hypothetical protein RAS1_37730 [Phycisphaerae bacterium RAS1]|nr:hypothetical protein RAS1_37730 [Phycisphaerae bacterium RAS1]
MPWLTAIPLLMAFAQEGTSVVPASLVRAIEARRAIVSGHMEWTLQRELLFPGRIFRFESRYAFSGDRLLKAWGDQDGWVDYNPLTQAPRHKFPLNYLVNSDGAWEHPETSVKATFWSTAPAASEESTISVLDELLDPRSVGLSPFGQSCFGVSKAFDADAERIALELHRALNKPAWEERRLGDRFEVVAKLYDGGEAHWFIDPQRGWSVERCTADGPGVGRTECTLELRELNGVWFPQEARYTRYGKLDVHFKVQSAEINKPDDPDRFSANEIGMEPGFNIAVQPRGGDAGGPRIWDGERMVSQEDWSAAMKRGEKTPGPTMQARRRGEHSKYMTPHQLDDWNKQHDAMHAVATSDEIQSAWLLYTTSTCERFALDDGQRQKAMDILADCQEQAGKVMGAIRDDLMRLQIDLSAARRKGDGEQTTDVQRRIQMKTQPIEDIYQKQLRPRLDELPTRQQREAAARRAESQPATQGAAR